MASGVKLDWRVLTATAASLLVFAACGNNQKAGHEADSKQSLAMQKKAEAAQKAKQIETLQAEIKKETARAKQLEAKIPKVMTESDMRLRLAQQFQNNAANTKDKQKKADLQARANKAQSEADAKGNELLATRSDMYAAYEHVRTMNEEIKTLTAEKAEAERIAAGKPAVATVAKVDEKKSKKSKRGQVAAKADSNRSM